MRVRVIELREEHSSGAVLAHARVVADSLVSSKYLHMTKAAASSIGRRCVLDA
jgi:hypothetical protein